MDRLEKDYRVIHDSNVNAYVQAIGDRIAKHLPPSSIRFRFVVVDTPDTNAYAMAGGRIMVTRKLISFVRSEDELAGVIGHELGHAVVRHHAIDISKYFKQILGIKSVGDRQDVFEKYNRFLESYRTKRVAFSRDHQNDKQLEADRIGIFAAYAAGYDPNATISYWKRMTDAKKVGFFASLFGEARPADKRLQEMVEVLKTIPTNCLDKSNATSKTDFDKWKSFVINYSGLGSTESHDGLIYRRSLVPLRPDLEHLKFSPDGQYILAQDNSTVTVLRKDPLSVLFRVEVEDAFPASFSEDSSTLIVYNRNLRVQKWNISGKNLMSTHEVAIPVGYWQTRISPDGNYVACYKYNGDLVVYDVATNEEVLKEKEFYIPTRWEVVTWQFRKDIANENEYPVLNLEFSPDGRYFLAGRRYYAYGFYYTFGLNFGRTVEEQTIAVDLAARKRISIGENVKKLLLSSMDFIDSNRIIGQYGMEVKKSGIFAFPSGERLAQFDLAGSSFAATRLGNYVVVRPVSGAAVGLYDMDQKKFLFGNAKPALDGHGKTFVAERRDGEIGLFNVETRENFASIALPASPFGTLWVSALSTDGNWLVVSDKSRAAAWDLRTGERKLHTRAFRGAYITPDAKVYADFPKQGKVERSVALMDLQTGGINPVGDLVTEDNIRQFGRYLVLRKAIHEEKEKPLTEEEKKKQPFSEETREKPVPDRNIVMEVHDIRDGGLLWKREFPNERPTVVISTAHDTMLLGWALNSDAVNQLVRSDPALRAKREKMGSKADDLFVELVDPRNGERKGYFLLETGEGSFSPENISWAGDYLTVSDNQNRVLVYSVSTGELLFRFFGSYPAVSPKAKHIAIENSPGRVMVADILTGKDLARLSFSHPVTLMRFVNDTKLFVLTADQTAFLFDTTKFHSIAGHQTSQK